MVNRARHYRVDPLLPEVEAAAWAPHLGALGWQRTADDDWSFWLCGGYPSKRFYRALRPHQWVSRIPGINALAVKRDLCENARYARHWTGGPVRDHPRGFLMPEDRQTWEAVAAQEPETLWLLKPQASRWGEGIALIEGPDDVPVGGDWMVQEYVAHPHLIDGHKYNLRFYLLVTSLDPLVCYLHEVATCRFATRPYTLDRASRADRFVHITNTAIQQDNDDHPQWSQRNSLLPPYLEILRRQGHDGAQLVNDVRAAALRLMIAARDQALMESRRQAPCLERCFDLLSLDVQVDEHLRPWILEFNAGAPMAPSAWKGTPDSPEDPRYDPFEASEAHALKAPLMSDLLSVVGFGRGLPEGPYDADGWQQRVAREHAAARGWKPLWPSAEAESVEPLFALLRPYDRAVAHVFCPGISAHPPELTPRRDLAMHRLGAGLALYEPREQRIHLLNAVAAAVWLGLHDALPVEEIVEEMLEHGLGADPAEVSAQVWDLLTVWAQKGLLEVGGKTARERLSEPHEQHEQLEQTGKQERAACTSSGPQRQDLRILGARRGRVVIVPLPEEGAVAHREDAEMLALPAAGVDRVLLVAHGDGPRASVAPLPPEAALDRLLAAAQSARLAAAEAQQLIEWLDQSECFHLVGPWEVLGAHELVEAEDLARQLHGT